MTQAGISIAQREAILALRSFSLACERYIDVSAAGVGVDRSHLNALAHIQQLVSEGEAVTPGKLGQRLALSSAATTALVDRMEAAGHIRRRRSEHDRRQVIIEPTPSAGEIGWQAFKPMAMAMGVSLAKYQGEQLALFTELINELTNAVDSTKK